MLCSFITDLYIYIYIYIYANHEFDLHRILVLNLQNRSPDSKCREDNYKKMRRLDLFCIWRSNGVASMILACAD